MLSSKAKVTLDSSSSWIVSLVSLMQILSAGFSREGRERSDLLVPWSLSNYIEPTYFIKDRTKKMFS